MRRGWQLRLVAVGLAAFTALVTIRVRADDLSSLQTFRSTIAKNWGFDCDSSLIFNGELEQASNPVWRPKNSPIFANFRKQVYAGVYAGLLSVERLNPNLYDDIAANTRGKKIVWTCQYFREDDLGGREGGPETEILADFVVKQNNYMIQSVAFHEFLHAARADNQSRKLHNLGYSVLFTPSIHDGYLKDTIYDCQEQAFGYSQILEIRGGGKYFYSNSRPVCEVCARARFDSQGHVVISDEPTVVEDAKKACSNLDESKFRFVLGKSGNLQPAPK